jgi:16S rRNA (cytosine967-C5)-methyltransferase
MREAQRVAAEAVARVLEGESLATALPLALDQRKDLAGAERARAQDLAYGTLRHYGLLAAVLKRLARKVPRPQRLRALLLVALYQLHATRAAPHAVVSEAVGLAGELAGRRARGFANAVLRAFQRCSAELVASAVADDETAHYSHPRWWIEALKTQYPERYRALLETGSAHPPMGLRVNLRRTTLEGYMALLAEAGLEARAVPPAGALLERPVPVERLPRFAEGWVSVQDLGAQLAPAFLDLQPGMRVLDACSAPGGKAAHLLEHADVALVALDRDPKRLKRVEANLARLGLSASLVCADGADPQRWWDGRPFQRVLADVPCSGSGVVRRHPDIKWLRRVTDLPRFAAEQGRILDGVWQVLDRGGKLLYVTCSVFAEENEGVIGAFLERHGDARLLPLPGAESGMRQLFPDASQDGFFYALLGKGSAEPALG